MTSFPSVQYTSSGTPRAFPQVKKQVHLGKDARSSDVLHFVCFWEEIWNCMHFLVILSLKTLWAGVKRWRTALHRFYVYRNTYFISCDSKMCTFEVLLFCVWCLDSWSRILSGTGQGVVLAIFYVFYPIFLRSSRETFVSPHYYFAWTITIYLRTEFS